ncbi:hypothetical protein EDM56_18370 [Brevibacillus fluminis]|uniref:Uncharacterized protein n=1 Tax=Brevibacillus fluminis TaxID=511487 RepID=A0A3M8DD75_9BACL|nr:beta/gamma crystallin-related protein [Brevibacillus fluminis]RNB85963.1 hypothetical protein EDM56_18370 [Brevibacillus fluminis]
METSLRLSLYSQKNYKGRRIRFKRGGVAIRDMHAFDFNNRLSSFRVSNLREPDNVTLVLFSAANFKGKVRVFRGSQNIPRLSRFGFDNITTSLILVCGRMSDETISQICRTGQIPKNILVISD